MFGLIAANTRELTPEQLRRYNGVYCGICRNIREGASNLCRLGLQYDMAFLALLHMSLYEPDERSGSRACLLHPVKPKPWIDNDAVRYAADMNVALAWHKCQDDALDDNKLSAKMMAKVLVPHCARIQKDYPRQWAAMEENLAALDQLEKENCQNPDLPAACFGKLMGELLVWKVDQWEGLLRPMGMALGRFIYLADAALDAPADRKKGRYNPFLALGEVPDYDALREFLVLDMADCAKYFEALPLVQDKDILDNILYSGVWAQLGAAWNQKEEKSHG